MDSLYRKPTSSIRLSFPMILRIVLSLILWTLGASMSI